MFIALDELQPLEMGLEVATFETASSLPTTGSATETGQGSPPLLSSQQQIQVVSMQMLKYPRMGWSQRGAHLLLQIRTHALTEAWEHAFRKWYPAFRPRVDREVSTAAKHPDSSALQSIRPSPSRSGSTRQHRQTKQEQIDTKLSHHPPQTR